MERERERNGNVHFVFFEEREREREREKLNFLERSNPWYECMSELISAIQKLKFSHFFHDNIFNLAQL